jgi:hypothetical protein
MVVFTLENLPPSLRNGAEAFLLQHGGTPAAILRPRVAITPNLCVAFSGNRIAEGTVGVGRTPEEALQDFNRTLQRPLRDGNGEANGRVALNSAELALLNRKSMMKQFRAVDFNRPFKLQRTNKRVNKRRKAS